MANEQPEKEDDLGTVTAVNSYNEASQQTKSLTHRASLGVSKRPEPLRLPFRADANPGRRDKILANLKLSDLDGIEIGALASPLVSPDEGLIIFVDHADTEALREKYRNDPSVDVVDIVQVNAIWGDKTLSECIGQNKKVDYVVASHVIEHTPDLITWLTEIRGVLKQGGSLRLAIPDRRYTFDYLRADSKIYDVLDAYIRRARAPLPRVIMENHTLSVEVDPIAAWNGTLDVGNLRHYNTIKNGLATAREVFTTGKYHDTHCWVFTPVTFAELCVAMADLDLLEFSCEYYFDTDRNSIEFYLSMIPCDSKRDIVDSWTRMKDALTSSSAASESSLERLQIEQVRMERDSAVQQLAQIRASASYRVTAPLRALRRALRPQ